MKISDGAQDHRGRMTGLRDVLAWIAFAGGPGYRVPLGSMDATR
ncbi:hypothetical protein [Xanthomonas albilineans]|nr:hypothetical protein [Xanthomonas albilineans]